jgi:hypothetical protein
LAAGDTEPSVAREGSAVIWEGRNAIAEGVPEFRDVEIYVREWMLKDIGEYRSLIE